MLQGRGSARTLLTASAVLFLAMGCAASQGTGASQNTSPRDGSHAPYAGLEGRPIAALSPERVQKLLNGEGAGYALAGELNHYPGPAHILKLGDELQLTAQQERVVEDVYRNMKDETKPLGQTLVDLERKLDQAFSDESITSEELRQLTARIADVEGRLRAAHLAAHLRMKEILTPEQVERYDKARGYTDGAGSSGDTGGPTSGGGHDHGG